MLFRENVKPMWEEIPEGSSWKINYGSKESNLK